MKISMSPIASLVFFLIVIASSSSANAAISGGTGNKPLHDPGWPEGAAKVFNWPTRIAYWEGPPFGGGQWHAESKGNAKEVNQVLLAFSKIQTAKKRVTIKNGIGYSFWLDPNQKKRGDRNTKIDWEFTVWVPESWKFQQGLPTGMSATEASGDKSPVPTLTIYTASVPWSEIDIPNGIEIDDQTLESHGFESSDGRVLQGTVVDATSAKPIMARVTIERVMPQTTGGYKYESKESTKTNSQGEWTLTNLPDEWSRVLVEADGYAPRISKYFRYDKQPGWESVETILAKTASVTGVVQNSDGSPVEGVRVFVRQINADDSGAYKLPRDPEAETAADGRFSIPSLPAGKANLSAYKAGFNGPSLGMDIEIPATDLEVLVTQSADLLVEVNFPKPLEQKGYIVEIEDIRGAKPGTWGGSANVDESNSVRFENVFPGTYMVTGRPNPGNGQDFKIQVKLIGGESKTIEVDAK